jgi:hypothetical protein
MPTKKQTISVRLDERAKRRVEFAARLLRQSSGAFLEKAGDEQARRMLIRWALDRHGRSEASFSELAAETGLAVEEIMLAAEDDRAPDLLEAFINSCRVVGEVNDDPEFLRTAEEAARLTKDELSRPATQL